MKTTIELADDLFLLAKQRALEQGTTLRGLIESALRHALAQAPGGTGIAQRYQFPVIHNALTAADDIDVNALIDTTRDEGLERFMAEGRGR